MTSNPSAGGILAARPTKHNTPISPAILRDRALFERVRRLRPWRLYSLLSRDTGPDVTGPGADISLRSAALAECDSAGPVSPFPSGFDLLAQLRAAPRYRVLIVASDMEAREFFMVAVDAATAERRALALFTNPLSITIEPADAGPEIPSGRLTTLGEDVYA